MQTFLRITDPDFYLWNFIYKLFDTDSSGQLTVDRVKWPGAAVCDTVLSPLGNR